MNPLKEFMYPVALTPELKGRVRERLQTHLISQTDTLLGRLSQPAMLERLGERAQRLHELFGEMLQRAATDPEEVSRFFGHWSVPLLMGRLFSPETREEFHFEQLTSTLLSHVLGPRLQGRAGTEARYVTASGFYLSGQDARLRVRGPEGVSRIVWEFSGDQVTLRAQGESSPFARVSLPLGTGSPVEIEPLPRSECWGVPIIDDNTLLGLSGQPYHEGIPSDGVSDGWQPLTLAQSVDGAYRLIQKLWPEVIDWADVLLPCFVDMGGPLNKTVHRSASYGAGTPIFLSKVDDPLEHAEDIVHELQHERLYLVLNTSVFGKWKDPRQQYVSPYRSDPRPLFGLHLGVHSFLAVNELRLRVNKVSPLSEERRYQLFKSHRMNLFAFRTMLEHEEISPEGRPMFAQMARALSSQHGPIMALSAPEMIAAFGRRFEEHVANVSALAPVLNAAPFYSNWDETVELAARYADREEVQS